MCQPYNQLTPAQAERLALLLEELGEVQQQIGKILRHGYGSYDPTCKLGNTNRTNLEWELGHVVAATQMLVEAEDVFTDRINHSAHLKRERIHPWLHHQEDSVL